MGVNPLGVEFKQLSDVASVHNVMFCWQTMKVTNSVVYYTCNMCQHVTPYFKQFVFFIVQNVHSI